MGYKYYGLDAKVQRWNRQLSHYLKIQDQAKALEAEKYIIEDVDFVEAIEKTRNELGISENYPNKRLSNVHDAYNWFDSVSTELHLNKDFGDLAQAASDICAKLNLPYGWTDYVSTFICLNERPKHIEIEPELLIDVIGIDEGDSLIIRIDKGLSRKDYIAAWKAFDNYFKEIPIDSHTDDSIKRRIYLDHIKYKMSPGDLAKKYYPVNPDGLTRFQYTSITTANRDKVKKIIKRLKNPNK